MSSDMMEITGSSLETESREAPSDSAILHLCEHPIDFRHEEDIYTSMFVVALFKNFPGLVPAYLSINE